LKLNPAYNLSSENMSLSKSYPVQQTHYYFVCLIDFTSEVLYKYTLLQRSPYGQLLLSTLHCWQLRNFAYLLATNPSNVLG